MADAQEYKPQAGDKIVKLSEVVSFKVNYPKEYKGKKHLKEGATISLHIDQAKYMEELSIGKIVTK